MFENNPSSSIAAYYTGSNPLIVGCVFKNNTRSAIYGYQGKPTVVNCVFYDNDDPSVAGAIALENSSATIANCTIVQNTSTSEAGGITCMSSSPTITNCIVRDNTPAEIANGTPTVTYCNVKGGFAGDGNIDGNPFYVDPDNYDFRIGPASPCIDAGNNGAVPSGVTTDLNGNPRFVEDPFTDDTGIGDPPIVDIGANEYQADATGMWVIPMNALKSEGPNGGPFTPDSMVYYVRNYSDAPIEFSAAKSQAWLELDSTGGTIPVGSTAEVTASIADGASSLPNGLYEDAIEFVNESTHEGDTTRLVTLEVGVPVPVIVFDLNDDPGWSVQGQWAFGQPTGQGGAEFGNPDPDSGFTGDNVYGVNLDGDYSIAIGGPYYATTNALDCSNMTQVWLHFRRWLNSDYQPYVLQTVDVSNDGENWTEIWTNGSVETADSIWSEQILDISSLADNQATVYVRWGHQVATSGAWAYSGWNIDDIEIWGVEPSQGCPADVNLDGQVDIDDLFAVLGEWGSCFGCLEDINNDNEVDIDDVFAVLADWGPC